MAVGTATLTLAAGERFAVRVCYSNPSGIIYVDGNSEDAPVSDPINF